jgi:hypothetical protein
MFVLRCITKQLTFLVLVLVYCGVHHFIHLVPEQQITYGKLTEPAFAPCLLLYNYWLHIMMFAYFEDHAEFVMSLCGC